MNFVGRQATSVVIRQIPVLLLVVAALFSLPLLAFSLTMILNGQDADGKYFCLFLGLFLLWVFLEFIATRERIEIEQTTKTLTRTVNGVFRHQRQTVKLGDIIDITVEKNVQSNGLRNQRWRYLYMNGRHGRFLLNSPSKISIDHRETAKILHDVTGIPYREQGDGEKI